MVHGGKVMDPNGLMVRDKHECTKKRESGAGGASTRRISRGSKRRWDAGCFAGGKSEDPENDRGNSDQEQCTVCRSVTNKTQYRVKTILLASLLEC